MLEGMQLPQISVFDSIPPYGSDVEAQSGIGRAVHRKETTDSIFIHRKG
jgi:hypothetical protein